MRISKRACDDLMRRTGAAAAGRPHFWDDLVPGFGVRLYSERQVSFVLKYRVKGDPRQRYRTLGEYPTTSPDQAREEASAIKAAAKLGRDLVAERQAEERRATAAQREAERQGVPLAELLDFWRAVTEAAMAEKAARGESVLYERELLRLEAKVLRPEVGGATIGDFDPDRFQALLSVQRSVSTARNLRNLMVRFTKLANAEMVRRGLPVRWPTGFEVNGRPRSRAHRFTLPEVAKLWIAAGALGRRGALLRWMLLTGCRRIEAQKVEWGHIRFEDPQRGPYWLQPPHLTKNHLPHAVPLPAPAVALLRWLPRRETKKSGASDLIFAGRGGRPVGDWTVIRRALLEGAGVEAGTLHDFRRTMVSALGDHGFDPQVADALLNHAAAATMGGVMGVYQRSELWAKRREAMGLWADLVMEAVGKAQGKPVCRETWGFDQPFREARIVRPERAGPRSAPRSGIPGPRRRKAKAPA